MILGIAKNIVTWLIEHDAVQSQDRELYEYAVYSLIITFSPVFLIILMGSLVGRPTESLFIIFPFMAIRKFSGGYHAKHDWTCFLGSCGLLFLCIYFSARISCSMELCFVTFCAVVSLSILSPIDSENRRLTPQEKKRYKLATRIISLLFMVLFLILMGMKIERYAVCVAVGLLLSAGLQIPCILEMLMKRWTKINNVSKV